MTGDVVRDVERLADQLSRPTEAVSIVTHWLDELTMNGFRRMSDDDRESLTSIFSSAMVKRKGFDGVIADLIAGRSSSSSSWYNAMASHGEAAMHHRLAAVSMNADLRCTRCHDASNEGKGLQQVQGLQQDHWAFVALLRQGPVKRR